MKIRRAAEQRGAGQQHHPAGPGGKRCQIGPALADGDRPFEADYRTEEGSDHQRAMHPRRLRGRGRYVPVEAGETGQHAAEQRQHAEEEQGKAPAGLHIGHCSASIMLAPA